MINIKPTRGKGEKERQRHGRDRANNQPYRGPGKRQTSLRRISLAGGGGDTTAALPDTLGSSFRLKILWRGEGRCWEEL